MLTERWWQKCLKVIRTDYVRFYVYEMGQCPKEGYYYEMIEYQSPFENLYLQ